MKKIRQQNKLTIKQLAKQLEIERKAAELIESKTLIPTVALMEKIEELLEVDRLDLYTKEDLTFIKRKKCSDKNTSNSYKYYHVNVRIDRKYKPLFSKEALKIIGSGSLHHWFGNEIQKLSKKMYNKINRQIKKDPTFNYPDELQILFQELFGSTYNITKKD